ncbi:hypothetical protein EMIHUDRAFT_62811 [Emiliania huxleyi CCMP1516]|uniref:Nitrate/nitrite transporter n=2 Tax=Emiliania huxleyi TaxID=2903 RepID=A0A0D3KQY4_EMIH1|nr:hypothetical protein EMIHUDRAFT_62811 [Emiliania huxleyi CCMP1516]EOD38169.1 hypothetical protein EMIHUDRAFT_62811 [Emiliania huxleyi CCMP1516]|eukprot:XP_005790598.1 hypothetical protein EMIHUDRAFT_62811 [Emiliania huxleyi CCMP1516]
MSAEEYELLKAEVATLHETLEGKGMNSKGTKDVFGRLFPVPVDEEHKSTVLFSVMFNGIVPNFPQPHMHAFWAATFGFFSTFFSVFAPAALMPYLKKSKEDGGLDLTPDDIATSGSFAVAFTIVMRVLAGPLCDVFGARWTFFGLLWLGIPGIIVLAFAESAQALWAARSMIGLSLASFVTCQVWCSQMFTKKIVGTANATAGGWGNLGGGVTQLVMPQIMLGFLSATDNDIDRSWRLCMIVPAALHVISSIAVITGRDLPDGNYRELEKSGVKEKKNGFKTFAIGVSNVNTWILTIGYAFCFGVELTMNNKAVNYFYTYYAVTPQIAGILGSCFGLMNLFARSWGGILSDAMNVRYGMRGRLWSMWVVQALEGMMCIIMGQECVRNQGTLGVTMVVMVLFSIFMAEGLHFGVVPYVSAPALGVVSGMVGAGGNFGAVMGSKFIVGPPSVGPPSVDKGFINLGPRRASQRSVGSPPREARLICPGPSSPSHRRHHHGHLAPLLWDVLPGARGHALQEGRPRQLRPAALQARRRRTRR